MFGATGDDGGTAVGAAVDSDMRLMLSKSALFVDWDMVWLLGIPRSSAGFIAFNSGSLAAQGISGVSSEKIILSQQITFWSNR